MTATTVAATAVRSRSGPRRRRFRWKSIHASFSKGSSVRAIPPQERKALAKQYGSILDEVSEEAAESPAKTRRAGSRHARGLSGNRSRDRTARSEDGEAGPSNLNLPEVPLGIPPSFDEQLNLMFDIVTLAYQANLTRVFTFMMAEEATDRTYNHIGVPDSFHAISHHQNCRKSSCRSERFRCTTPRSSPNSLRNLRRCRTATAPCWIIRSFFTAAT